jgi:hypothetical protein
MFEDDELSVNAEQEDVADSPIEETEELTDEAEATEEAEPGDDGAAEEADQAAPAKQQPDKKQSKAEDSKYAAARKEAEAQARAIKAEAEAAKQRMDAFAKQYGYQSFEAMERAEAAKKYVEQGIPDVVAQKLADTERELAEIRAEREAERQKASEIEKLVALQKAYPETAQMEVLPDRVLELMEQGETPVNAYRAYKVEQLMAENSALKQNAANKDKALGNVKGKAPVRTNSDPFLEGLN